MEKDKKTGAIRKEDGAKAPDSSDAAVTDAAVADKAPADKAPADKPLTDAEKKVKKAANDKASKIKREKEATAKELAEAEAEAKRGFFIAEGKAISCKKGILGPGDKVTPENLGNHDGEAVFKRLVESGAIVEVK